MKKYRAPFDYIYPAHLNAWESLFGTDTLFQMSQEELNKRYHDNFRAILVHKNKGKKNERYAYIEFDSREDYVLFMLEWS
jgi:hypothetical protein